MSLLMLFRQPFNTTIIKLQAGQQQLAGDQVTLLYNSVSFTPSSLDVVWTTRANIADDFSVPWRVTTAVPPASSSLVWNIRALTAEELFASWDQAAHLRRSFDLLWYVTQLLTSNDHDFVWRLQQLADRALELRWSQHHLVSADESSLWHIVGRVAQVRAFDWDVLQLLADDLQLVWSLGPRVLSPRTGAALLDTRRRSEVDMRTAVLSRSTSASESSRSMRPTPSPRSAPASLTAMRQTPTRSMHDSRAVARDSAEETHGARTMLTTRGG